MTLSAIPSFTAIPQVGQSEAAFDANADTFVSELPAFIAALNQLGLDIPAEIQAAIATLDQSIAFQADLVSQSSANLRMFLTAGGQPTWYFRIPKFQIEDIYKDGSLGTGTHPAFITSAGEAENLWISAYHLTYKDGEMVSQPGLNPTVSMTQDTERSRCAATVINGFAGNRLASVWDIAAMSAQTYALIQGGMPQPALNDSYGKYSGNTHIRGTGATGIANGSMGSASTHNRQPDGVHSAYGGHWTRFDGAKTQDGEIFIAANNDPSSIATPATTTHYYTTGSTAGNSGVVDITADAASVVRNGAVGDNSNGSSSYRTGAAGHASVVGATTAMMKLAGLAPLGDGTDMSGGISTRNYGLRAFRAFGYWAGGSTAGPFCRDSFNAPSVASGRDAARSAFLEF